MKKNRLLLIDGNSIINRAFFALPPMDNGQGLHTNAIYGFLTMLFKMIKSYEPSHISVAFDMKAPTFRHKSYTEYKAGRKKMPGELAMQLDPLKDVLDKLNIDREEIEGYEADDILGTLSLDAEKEGYEVYIVTGDRDAIQLASDNTRVLITKKGVGEVEEYDAQAVMDRYSLTPDQFIDLKGLMGDKSDNIPGVTKIGEKTGIKLLLEHGSLEGIYENIDGMKASKMKENLINDKEQAFLSKTLATIETQAPIEIGLDDLVYNGPDVENLGKFYDEMGFKQLKQALNVSSTAMPESLDFAIVDHVSQDMLSADSIFHFELFGENYHTDDLVGFAWSCGDKLYVADKLELLQEPILKEFLEKTPLKVYDFKKAKVLLNRLGLNLQAPAFDSRLAKYLLSTVENNEISTIASLYGQTYMVDDETFYGKGVKKAIPEREKFLEHLARKVAVLVETEPVLLEKLSEHGQLDLLYDMEQPLAFVLAKMEIAGITVKKETLLEMQTENELVIEKLTQEIYELAGEEFNINSPKQLGVLLFEKLGLPLEYTKKTKTGYSTAVDVLERLAPIAPIVKKILDYRQIAKIQSTYVVGLQDWILDDGKIHTRYVQDLTQTGRLSSVDPNLQNIPVRLEQGRLIRKAFVPEWEDSVLLSSDYSQIELRVLAHISKDEHLIKAFQEGADIHTSTAMRVFGIERPEDVTPNDRRNAKAVNFGVVYGISDFGLANNLGISRKKAKAYIDTYFERFPGIKNYMEEVVREARDKGYVETLFKRRRELPDINSRNFNIRGFAERTAINSPIQGSAADILKIAMIQLDKALVAGGYQTKMLLQVHDEIVLEVPKSELAEMKKLVKQTMEEAIQLSVPLIADENEGATWYEAK